jgi:uncharacterized membrane protein
MEKKNYNQLAGQKIQRIEAITDGVFTIAMALLVLDLKIPITESIKSEYDLLSSLYNISPKLLTYLMSFMTLGIFWTGHSTQFNFIHHSNRDLNWICIFYLMFVSIVPFTTAFLSEHIEFKVAVGMYWLNILFLGLILFIQWKYALKQKFISGTEQEIQSVDKAISRRIVIAQILYASGALLCFVNTYLSISVIILIQLNYAFAFFSGRNKK